MKKTFSYTTNGNTMQMELNLAYYAYNRTLAVALFEQGHDRNEEYWTLTCCLDDAPGKNRAFLDVNNMGEQIVDDLEAAGFGTRTGRSVKSGYMTYPEFEFDAEVLKAYSNREYERYLKWQDIFPDMSAGERGLLARGQNMCDRCFKKMFGME